MLKINFCNLNGVCFLKSKTLSNELTVAESKETSDNGVTRASHGHISATSLSWQSIVQVVTAKLTIIKNIIKHTVFKGTRKS